MSAGAGRRLARLIALAAMVVVGLVPARLAFAHASLISAEPADGAVIALPPERLILIFNEPISPLALQLIDPAGQTTALTELAQHDATLIAKVPRRLGQGTHTLSWRVISADGHPVGGTVMFSVGHADARPPAVSATAADWPLRIAIWTARLALYVALFAGVGGALFAAWIAKARPLPGAGEKIILAMLWGGLVVLPVSVGLQGLDALGVPLSSLFLFAVWKAGFDTTYGWTAMLALAGLLAALVSMRTHGNAARLLSLAALIGVGLALAASGHASSATPQSLMRPAVFLHVAAVAFWIGSLWPLAATQHGAATPARQALCRFSRIIPWAVVVLLVSGGVLAVVQIAAVEALWTTAYGYVFLAKMAAVLLLFALAGINRFLLTPRLEAGDAMAVRGFRRSVGMEIAVALVILAIVAIWRFTPPPRALAAAASAPTFIHFHAQAAMANVVLDPGRVGRSSATIRISDADDEPMTPKAVTLVFSQPAAGIEPMRRDAAYAGDSTWRVDDLLIPAPGRWHLGIEILVSDFEKITIEDDIQIPP
jgi:copper transport protein